MNNFDAAAKQRFIDALGKRLKDKPLTCPFCNTQNWIVADGYVLTPLSNDPPNINIGGPSLPSAALVCSQCGHTVLFNLSALGIRDLVERKITPEGEAGFPQIRGSEEG
jgi:hypothetical protein